MKRKHLLTILAVTCCCIVIAGFILNYTNRHAMIDEWSSSLTANGFDWAQVAQGYGVDKVQYSLTAEDFENLAELLHEVTEDNCTRKYPRNAQRIDYRLALEYDGKLWLFHCLSNEMISITFEDLETAEYYGCHDSVLCVTSPKLYDYILDTVNNKAE